MSEAQTTPKAPPGFYGPLDLREMEDGEHFLLIDAITYRAKDGATYLVPAGTVTDFASTPRVLWNLLPPFGKHTRASVLHDWLYQTAPAGMSRDTADSLFREAMAVCGVAWAVRATMWAGVRAGGWVPWDRYRRQKPSN